MSKYDDMKLIRDEVMALKESPLYAYRVQRHYFPVLGEGSHNASIMFIGEAPGRNEAETGRPFCGVAGKLLDALLSSINLPRDKVYITNILKDRPPENRDPLPSEIELYGPFLDQQIEVIKPRVIATLGRFSYSYIMKHFDVALFIGPINQAHGKVFEAKASYGTLHIVPLYHPAAAIYNQHLKETLFEDFKVLKQFM